MASFLDLQLSNGISCFLLAILSVISCSCTTTSSSSNSRSDISPRVHSYPTILSKLPPIPQLEYNEFQIIMEAQGTPRLKQGGILHGPLTAVNAPLTIFLDEGGTKEDSPSKPTKSTRKLVGFPLETTTFPPFLSSSTTATAFRSVESQQQTFDTTTTTSGSNQYSIQVPRRPSGRTRRSTNHGNDDDDAGRRQRGKGRVIEKRLEEAGSESSKLKQTEYIHQMKRQHHGYHHQNHHNHQKREAATISPPFLFLKIFMDYSSLNEDGRNRVGSGIKGVKLSPQSANNGTVNKRRRSHRSFRTLSVDQVNNETGQHHHQVYIHPGHPHEKQQQSNNSSSFTSNDTLSGGVDYDATHQTEGNGTHKDHHHKKCLPESSSCPDGHFACKSNYGLCVPQAAICNGKPDCPDGSDEDKDCVNIHEKKFWDNYFKKRPAADVDDEEDAKGNGFCRYNASRNADEKPLVMVSGEWSKLGKKGGEGDQEQQQQPESLYELLETRMCRCSQEKILCHNVHLRNLLVFPEDIHFLDLSGSQVDVLEFPSGRFQRLETLVLSSCSIREISGDTFATLPSLKVLHLTGNFLKRIPPSAFAGSGNLGKLFLGHNHLESLDSESFHGLHSLEYLDLRKNRLTGEDSNVFHALGSLRTLHLNYNEIRRIDKDFFTGLSKLEMLSLSKNKISTISIGAFNHTPRLKHLHLSYNRLSVLENNVFCNLQDLNNLNLNDNGITRIEPHAFECLCSLQSLILQKNPFRELTGDEGESPRQLFGNLINLEHIYFDEWWMCWWAPRVRSCEPKGDGISSVENLLDNVILRVCVWIVGLTALGGNFFVIVSRLVMREKNRAHSFYIKNLALADLLMGLFLISIAFHDLAFRGHFLAHQHAWRHSITCQLSGMLSTLSSEASVFILFVITLDRYLSIVRPFAERTNALIPAVLICSLLWAISIFLSYAPMCPWFRDYFGRTFYTSNGLCLPLHIHNPYETGWEYSLFLFIIVNSVAFIFICYAYWRMLRIIQMSTTSIRSTQQKQDGMLVKRFGLVVFTDFLCWAPIIIIKCVAMAGVEIRSDLYAWLAIFVLPVNSALNPIIYTLSTKLFKQQVSHFTVGFRKRLGLATDESTTSYRNRISRTLQTSLNSSMMLSTRRRGGNGGGMNGGDSNNSTRVTVLRDRMTMANRMSSKVGSSSPPPLAAAAAQAGAGNVSPVVVSRPPATSPSSKTGREHYIPSEGNGSTSSKNENKRTSGSIKNTPTKVITAVEAEINGQIAQDDHHQPPQYQQQEVDGKDEKMEMMVAESQL